VPVASTMRCKWKRHAVATTLRLQLYRPAASLPAAPSFDVFCGDVRAGFNLLDNSLSRSRAKKISCGLRREAIRRSARHGQPDRIRLPRADGMQARLGALQEQLASAGAGSVLLGHHS